MQANESNAVTIARAYLQAWTNKDFGGAAALLADGLIVEVPINDYPTRDSFAEAVAGFGSLVTAAVLLAEMSAGDEAMQLYDIEVEGLGPMRIVEHFTVRDGLIVRIRQIHDTAMLRGAPA